MINKIDLRKAISSIAISNAKRNTIYRAFSDLDSITKEEFDSVKSDISKVVESMLTKDTVGKANGVASLDSNGSVPIEQLGNIDTTLFLIVRELPTTDIQSNKIYLVPNQNGKGDNVYLEYLYVEGVWEKVGEFKPEVDLSHIEAKLETKADKTDVNNRLDDLQNYCFKLGNGGRIATPFQEGVYYIDRKIQQLINNEEYIYADISDYLNEDTVCVYDRTLCKTIKIVKIDEEVDIINNGDFFRTNKPLDLTHTFYLDNEKTGIVENLTQLNIKESNIFVNFQYVEVDDNLDDDTMPQYIYDATDNKWIQIVETYYATAYHPFNTEEPLDLTHELAFSESSNIGNYTIVGYGSVALGIKSAANGSYAVALGAYSSTSGDYAIALGKNVSNTKSIFGVGFNGVNGIDMDRDNYGLYLKGFGGYDGTNLVVKSGNTETLNPNIKSVQQIINEKANASAIPTKVSQLTNDANFITSYTETDPVWTREKTNYYTKTEIDNKGYLTAHQSLDAYAEKKELDNVKNSIRDYVDSTLDSYVALNDMSILLSAKADLVDDKLKAEQLPKLFNITTAATTEEVVTKFNALLAYLKAKGYMEADTAK